MATNRRWPIVLEEYLNSDCRRFQQLNLVNLAHPAEYATGQPDILFGCTEHTF